MLYILFGVLLLSVLSILIYADKKQKLQSAKVLKVFSLVLFTVFLFRLFSQDAIDSVFNLFLVDVETNLDADTTWFLSKGKLILIIFLRWITIVSLTWAIIAAYIKNKHVLWIVGSVGLMISLLNIIYFKTHLYAFYGEETALFTARSIQFFTETALLFIISTYTLYQLVRKQLFLSLKQLWKPIGIFFASAFFLMPQTLLYNFFGNYGEIPDEFTNSHIFVIIFPIVLMFIIYFVMRHRTQNDKDLLLTFLAFAGFFQYFYMRRRGLPALPLHLCNTAVILLLFAVVFRIKSLFYFAYFANVLGAIGAILLPNYSSDLFSLTVIHFGYNHLYALIIPILGVALHMFPRPVLSHMLKAVGVFSIYYLVVVNLNAWFNNYSTVDYFFAYSDFLTDMFGLRSFQYQNVIEFSYKDLNFIYYWAFQLVYYLIFVFVMFASWFVYDFFYQTADSRYQLSLKQKMMKYDQSQLIKLLDGRKPSEPMNPGGVDMIKITNFSKRYGQSAKFAVKNFSLEVNRGEVFGFLGHNGAGKSTTIKSLVGIQSITEGEMEICGYSIKSQPLEAKLRMGYVSDNHAVYEKLTGREYIHYVADLYRVDFELRDKRLKDLSERLSLDHAMDQMVKSYSHGMKQKLVVIASLIHEPIVWVLDEPLTGLDPISAYQIKEIMKDHAAKGNIVFFSSHVIEVVEKICTKIAVITQGELMGVYEIKKLKEEGVSLEDLYMKDNKNLLGASNV